MPLTTFLNFTGACVRADHRVTSEENVRERGQVSCGLMGWLSVLILGVLATVPTHIPVFTSASLIPLLHILCSVGAMQV
jgi:hypothetical protein